MMIKTQLRAENRLGEEVIDRSLQVSMSMNVSSGILAWNKTFNRSNWDKAHSIQQTTDGGYIVAGARGYYEEEKSPSRDGFKDSLKDKFQNATVLEVIIGFVCLSVMIVFFGRDIAIILVPAGMGIGIIVGLIDLPGKANFGDRLIVGAVMIIIAFMLGNKRGYR